MDKTRQLAFQKLRPVCVELSSVALKFRGNHSSVKSVLQALIDVHQVLSNLGQENVLDAKLAEYAFFPLTHVFNESQRLSPASLDVAVQCLHILVSRGWRENLLPEMGKQLLILLTLLAGGSTNKPRAEPLGEDLKVTALRCMGTILQCLGASEASSSLFDSVSTRNIVDQTVFLLLEAIAEDPSDQIQLAASQTLLVLIQRISNRLVLASLLPRTVSSLTKALQSSTQARRTSKVLEANLNLLRETLCRVLSDTVTVVNESSEPRFTEIEKTSELQADEAQVLDQSWLKATSSQVKIALTRVARLRTHDRPEVRHALVNLCLTVVEECRQSLADSVPLLVETLIVLEAGPLSNQSSVLKHLLLSYPALVLDVRTSLHRWVASLPRLMQGSDDRPRQMVLSQISTTIEVLSSIGQSSEIIRDGLATTLIDVVVMALRAEARRPVVIISEPQSSLPQLLSVQKADPRMNFQSVVLTHKSQRGSLDELQIMLEKLASIAEGNTITKTIIDTIPFGDGNNQLSAIWLAINLLRGDKVGDVLQDFIVTMHTKEIDTKPYLIAELYGHTLPLLFQDQRFDDADSNRQIQALALECVVLQAGQLGISYRPELMDSLYPILSFSSSQSSFLQQHAMTALNLLASACEYSSTTDMLIDNVDYLVNSIGLKLAEADLAPQGPQVLLMMVHLCGARLIPYLDDLIGYIFDALDKYHGYPKLVDMLFAVLSSIADEGAKTPHLALTDGKEAPQHLKNTHHPSSVEDVLNDLSAMKTRKRKAAENIEGESEPAPRRPWSDNLNGPAVDNSGSSRDLDIELGEDDEGELPVSNSKSEKEKPLSKSHELLLKISQSTTPHLSSPSPKVRNALLRLIDQVTRLLAHDENSFLPFINAVWPALTARLFDEIGEDGTGEMAYNVCAASETVSTLCQGAGDFMASRIEDIFPQLEQLFRMTWSKIKADRSRKTPALGKSVNSTSNLTGSVDLHLGKTEHEADAIEKSKSSQIALLGRTSDLQVFNGLVHLLVKVLNFVKVTDENGDTILAMLAPIMDELGREDVRLSLQRWNVDAVWLIRQRKRIESEMAAGRRDDQNWTWRRSDVSSPMPSNLRLRDVVF